MFGLSLAMVKLIAVGVMIATVLGLVTYVKLEWDAGQRAKVQVAVAKTQAKVETKAIAKVDTSAVKAETKAQAQIVVQTKTIVQRIPVYVSASPTPPVGCITWGMLKLHDAAVLGTTPDKLQAPSGDTDDSCSTTPPSVFMGTIVGNYGAANANAEQLNALIADENTRLLAAAEQPIPPSK